MNWEEYTQGGIGAIVGSVLTIMGFKGRLNNMDKRLDELREDTHAMQKEVRNDIKKLIAKTAERRSND